MAHNIFKRAAAMLAAAAVIAVPASANMPSETVIAAPDEYHDDCLHVNDKAEIVYMNVNP